MDPQDNFFSLGGQSLLAIQCLSLLREKMPIRLSLSDFFENATVAQQAALIRSRLRPDNVSSADSRFVGAELLQKAGPPRRRDDSAPGPLASMPSQS